MEAYWLGSRFVGVLGELRTVEIEASVVISKMSGVGWQQLKANLNYSLDIWLYQLLPKLI